MDFYWNVFASIGSIEAYMCHKEYERLVGRGKECVADEHGECTRSCDKGNAEWRS